MQSLWQCSRSLNRSAEVVVSTTTFAVLNRMHNGFTDWSKLLKVHKRVAIGLSCGLPFQVFHCYPSASAFAALSENRKTTSLMVYCREVTQQKSSIKLRKILAFTTHRHLLADLSWWNQIQIRNSCFLKQLNQSRKAFRIAGSIINWFPLILFLDSILQAINEEIWS